MNQTRTFLLFALLAVAYFLFMAWEKDYGPHPPAPTVASSASAAAPASSDSVSVPTASGSAAVPGATSPAPGAAPAIANAPAKVAPSQQVTISTDVLRLTVDTRGGSIVRSELLDYPVTPRTKKNPDPAPIRLLDETPSHYFAAQDGLVSADGPAPDHRALFQATQTSYTLAPGKDVLVVDLTWTDPSGLKVVKRYTLHRGSYVVDLDQQIDNGSAKAWNGNAYRQLQRVEPPAPHYSNFLARISDQSHYGFFGAAWYSPEHKFNKLAFDKFAKEPLHASATGGWVAMMQQYFVGAWIPKAGETDTFSTAVVNVGNTSRYLIRSVGPQISVAPGKQGDTSARLYVGPKLPDVLGATAPGFQLTIDYGMLKIFAVPLHWVLAKLDKLTGNWGVSIILLVLLINLATYKLTNAQYASAAKMRKLKPRMDALKERYGDDKQKMQQATMELYKKEKINPVAGCLPMLITIPIFYGLYYVLRDSVELRQAPFFGWIHDLSAADPYFVLPIIYAATMLIQQLLMPAATGMDPTQAKMMKFMPVIFAVIFLFFPAGLCLYYVVNGLCRLGQQWWVTKRYDAMDTKAKTA
ncbi:membrane protein insertase YidC [Rhodanobacter glycinis]|uniref:Membrane protein insertase YidC n=1 Tax=Rhodanobacter glycinis TaxID=582702 RepID=A0A5B9DYY0_9GAMM|nr:membrane protein insertase YidC [Rhodanobacter glycinis]QEE23156.1 membrane protein insertase YidC [Rhodanobacter glycinis]